MSKEILKITDIINNAKDELERSLELLKENEYAQMSMLISDIESSLERMVDINERIEFALILSNYAGAAETLGTTLECTDNEKWRHKFIEAASKIEFLHIDNGKISSEWAYNEASDIIDKMLNLKGK